MDILHRNDIEKLIERTDGLRVSILLPTQKAGDAIQQNAIRLKNLIKEAESQLVERGLRQPEAEQFLAPARRLVQDNLFWQEQEQGLALFLSSDWAQHYRLPLDFEPLVILGEHFYIKPLLPLLGNGGRFYVLALSQEQPRLFQGTRYGLQETDLEAAPAGLDQALRYDDPERRVQFHTTTRGPGGKGERPASFHGQGGPEKDEKKDILRYFHKVDQAVSRLLAGHELPLVLAGVDYLLPLYREANTYPHLVEAGVTESMEALDPQTLHTQAWKIVQPLFARARQEAAEQYKVAAHTDQAANTIQEIVPAAVRGRVAHLFVEIDQRQWGRFDEQVQVHAEPQTGDEELLNLAALHTLLNSGAVYAVDADDMPDETSVAAVFRYEM